MANNTLKYRGIEPALREDQRRAWNQPVLWPIVLLAGGLAAVIAPAVVAWRRHERQAA
jgi:hypothetical protein